MVTKSVIESVLTVLFKVPTACGSIDEEFVEDEETNCFDFDLCSNFVVLNLAYYIHSIINNTKHDVPLTVSIKQPESHLLYSPLPS